MRLIVPRVFFGDGSFERSHFENGELRIMNKTGQQHFARFKYRHIDKTNPLRSRQPFRQEPRQYRLDDRVLRPGLKAECV